MRLGFGWFAIAAMAGGLAAGALDAAAQGASSTPSAQGAQALQLRSLAASCTQCHGTAGRAVDGSVVPGLAGMPAPYLVEQMQAYKSGTRPASVMHQLAKGYSDVQIERIAAWFAAQQP